MTLNQIYAMDRVLEEVREERHQQHERFGEQSLPDGKRREQDPFMLRVARAGCDSGKKHNDLSWRDLLTEEVLEAFVEAGAGSLANLRAELLQVAALAVQQIEDIDRRILPGWVEQTPAADVVKSIAPRETKKSCALCKDAGECMGVCE